jgi:predicted DNA-binding transcriptional regulator AlpA
MTAAPPAYLSRSTLARELDCAESTVDELVKRGTLPKPFRLSGGCVRWRWADVEVAIGSLKEAGAAGESDPYLKGMRGVTTVG